MTEFPIRRDAGRRAAISQSELLWVLAPCAALSLAAVAWSWRHGAMLNYGDAVAHLHIARRVFDSRLPRFTQLGSVWLPLPHILVLPFVQVYSWWANGFAGAIPSALAYLAGCVGVYRLARHWLRPPAAALALAVFATNPNLLYLQTTAMTEPLFLCEMIWIAVWLVEWRACLNEAGQNAPPQSLQKNSRSVSVEQDKTPEGPRKNPGFVSGHDLSRAEKIAKSARALAPEGGTSYKASRLLWLIALVLVAAIFTRYDGWVMALLAWSAVGVVLARHGALRSPSFWLASVLVVAAPVAWFVYNSSSFGDWLFFARGPYSAKVIEIKTSTPGFPPHPGWHNPWVSLLFFVKAAELDAAAAAWGNVFLVLALMGTAWGGLIARRRSLLWAMLLWLPVPFYAYSVAYGSVPIFLPSWWPHSWYNLRYGMELLPALALGLGFLAHLILAAVRDFKPQWARHAVAVLFALVVLNAVQMLRERPLVYVEGTKNIHARQPMYSQIPPVLRALLARQPDAVILMDTSLYPEIVSLTGIPLRQTINESDLDIYATALSSPATHAAIVLAFEGGEIDQAVHLRPEGLTAIRHFAAPGQPSATLYVSGTPNSSRLNKPPTTVIASLKGSQ